MFQVGSASGYQDLLKQLLEIITATHFPSVTTVAGGGTGYAVDDILEIDGGTSTHKARLRVTDVSGGVIQAGGVEIASHGAYSSTPSNDVSVTKITGSSNDDATFTMAAGISTGWSARRDLVDIGVTVGVVNVGGTGYATNDTLTVVGGTGTAATFNVDTQSAGVVTAISLVTHGTYTVAPGTTAVTTTVAPAGGSGATLDLTIFGVSGEDEAILEGVDDNFIGIRTFSDVGDTYHNWELAGMTGYSAGSSFSTQPNISPGRHDNQSPTSGGAYMTLTESSAMDFWVFSTGRRIYVVAKAGSAYPQCHLGLLNPFGTTLELPYPMYICGNIDAPPTGFGSTTNSYNCPIDPTSSVKTVGPGLFRFSTGSWGNVENTSTQSTRTQLVELVVYPMGTPVNSGVPVTNVELEDQVIGDSASLSHRWEYIIPVDGFPGTQDASLRRTPDTGGDLMNLVPATLIVASATQGMAILGELDEVFWITTHGGAVTEDFIDVGTSRYRIFQNGNKTELWTFTAVREN